MPTWVFILLAIVAANLPWLSDRVFLIFSPRGERKSAWLRLLEWLVLYAAFLALGFGLERMVNGEVYKQDWEFYVVTALLFLVFAIPGFVYCYDLKKHLKPRM